ncbi:beta strand repeat-containing protein [Acinetobacter modestus]|uniref:beta strand repeat-containing protein n=1 Tax=Acinetobacter modestus TaxID=1776740 RepID=UPI00320B5AF5
MLVSKQKMKKNISNYGMMNHKASYIYTLVLFILTCLMCSQAVLAAPPTIEIYSGSGSGQGPTAGPVVTTFKLNANNPSDNNYVDYAPLTTATYTITNSAFNLASYQGSGATNRPNLTIGGTGTAATVQATNVIQPLVSIGSAQDNMFAASLQNAPTGCTNGSGCYSTNGGIRAGSSSSDTTANYGVAMYIKTTGFGASNVSTSNRVYVGRVEVNFNRPVTNPILQAAGMGAATANGLGYSAEFTLVSSNLGSLPVLSRLAGSKELSVIGNDITNNASTKSATSDQGGASGSIYIKGKGITTLVFDMYIRGDGKGTWTDTAADSFFFGISSMDADSDLSIVKSQRIGTSGTFAQTQLNNVPLNSIIQYQLLITNNKPTSATIGGSTYLAPFSDEIPSNLKTVSIVGTASTTGTGTTCSPTLSGNDTSGYTLTGTFSGASTATCTIVIQATAKVAGTITNTAKIEGTSTDSASANDSSSVNAVIVNPTAITADTTVKEARFTITPDLPTIVRGRVGTQTINIKNEGPDSATNAIATYIPAPQTGVTIASVSVVGGAACTPSGSNWNCNLGNMANGAIKQLSVSYSTTAASSLGTAQQATVKVSSDEFNPGSGVGETLYKVWGSNQQNEYRPNGAFWVGYEGTGGTAKVGAFADENSSIVSAWPVNQASPTGGYLVSGNNGTSDSTYGASSTTASAMIQRIITNMSSDANATVQLNNIDVPDIGDNRRAWEFTTGVYIPTSQAVTFCVGNTGVGVDDGAYIMVDGVAVTSANGYVPGGVIATTATTLSAGYHRISYRIVNRNTYSGGSELSPGGYGSIGLSLSGSCSTSNYDNATTSGVPASINIIDGAKIKIAKNSVNGTGTFNYINLSNLVNSTTAVTTDSVTTVTAGTTATSAQQLWAQTLNTDVSFTESALAGYVLSGVSCVDANSGVTGNTGTFWTLVNNIVTIPAVRIKEGANITCTFTNTKLIYVDITGRVFVDNSGTTLDVSKAYNGIQDAGEVGIANSTIRLNNCSTTTQLASTLTSANGDYAFSIEQSLLPSSFCIVQQNLPEYISVSGTTGYTRSTDTIALTKTSATSYTANNFGDVIVNVVLNEDGQHTAIAGDVTDYPHRLSTKIPVQLTQLLQTQTQQPNASADQPWQALVYRDTNCNGQVDMGEVVFNPTATSTILLQPSVDICLVQRVHVPTNVATGAQHIGTLQASYQFALTNPSQTILGQTLKRQDVTLIGSAGLTLTKKVRAVASCPSTSSDTNAFVTTNQAAKQDNLEYEITYKNNSTKKLQNVKVKDSLPIGTNFGSVSCSLTPSGNTCNTSHSGDYLEWSLTGLLNPSASGTLRFCVSQ